MTLIGENNTKRDTQSRENDDRLQKQLGELKDGVIGSGAL